jgi:hypothetical protein
LLKWESQVTEALLFFDLQRQGLNSIEPGPAAPVASPAKNEAKSLLLGRQTPSQVCKSDLVDFELLFGGGRLRQAGLPALASTGSEVIELPGLIRRNAVAGGVLLLLILPAFLTADKRTCVTQNPRRKGAPKNLPHQLVGALQAVDMEDKTMVRMEKKVCWQCPQNLAHLLGELLALHAYRCTSYTASAYSTPVLFPRESEGPGNWHHEAHP